MTEDLDVIGPDETAYTLDLTPAQLKVTWSALHALLNDFGHEEADVQQIIHEVLAKLPDEHAVRAIQIL
jgi:hypothetical protein